jgi:hypothetical protein
MDRGWWRNTVANPGRRTCEQARVLNLLRQSARFLRAEMPVYSQMADFKPL